MYKRLDKYVYVLEFTAALLPRIALPCKEMRDGVVVVRARTVRDVLDAVARDAFGVATRDTTLRDATPRDVAVRDAVAVVPRDAVVVGRPDATVARDAVFVVVARDAVGVVVARAVDVRDETPRETTFVVVPPRLTMFAESPRDVAGREERDVVAPARGDWGTATVVVDAGAIGSAKTARIDTNVEQTKNAPANRNTVPIAFLQCSAKLRLFINTLLYSGNARKTRCLTM